MRRLAFAMFAAGFLAACQSSPPAVTASRNLVENVTPSSGKEAIPTQLYETVTTAQVGSVMNYRGAEVVLLNFYRSALGSECRRVRVAPADELAYIRIACEQADGVWMLEPNVVYGGDDQLFVSDSRARGDSQ